VLVVTEISGQSVGIIVNGQEVAGFPLDCLTREDETDRLS